MRERGREWETKREGEHERPTVGSMRDQEWERKM